MSIIKQLDDIIRVIRNRVWQQGGCEAIGAMDAKLRTCDQCGYENDELVNELRCPMCGKGLHGRRYLDERGEG